MTKYKFTFKKILAYYDEYTIIAENEKEALKKLIILKSWDIKRVSAKMIRRWEWQYEIIKKEEVK